MSRPSELAPARNDLLVAAMLLGAGAYFLFRADDHLSGVRSELLIARNRRVGAEELAEQRREQLDGALERIQELVVKINDAEHRAAVAERKAARTPAKPRTTRKPA